MDTVSPERRSEIMRKVRSKDTSAEWFVRRMIHAMGFRYRLHDKNLPGMPDLVFAGRKKLIFVHGCFWHNHDGCKRARIPQSNRAYWSAKIARNVSRDFRNLDLLEQAGWRVLVVWECELALVDVLETRIKGFLNG